MRGRSNRSVLAAGLLLVTLVPIAARSASTTVLIAAVFYETYLNGDPDEAFRITNVGGTEADLSDWTVTELEGTITLTDTLPAGKSFWIAREAVSLIEEFGFKPDYEYGANSDPTIDNLAKEGNFQLANSGDQIVLKNSGGGIVDSVVYDGGMLAGTNWTGNTVSPCSGSTTELLSIQAAEETEGFGTKGQLLFRKMDQSTGQIVADTDTVADWAQATDGNINGKKVMYPGWDLDRYLFTDTFTETATITRFAALAPG